MHDQWRLTAFRAAHAQALELRPKARAVLEGLGGVPELAARYEAAGPAWTLFAGALRTDFWAEFAVGDPWPAVAWCAFGRARASCGVGLPQTSASMRLWWRATPAGP